MTITWSEDGAGNRAEGPAAGATGRALAAPDDRALIERAQAGDREAFEALVHRYDRDVLRIALNILHRPEDARDVYQEAFLKIYKNLHRFRFEAPKIRRLKPGSRRVAQIPPGIFSTGNRSRARRPIRNGVSWAWKSEGESRPRSDS